MSLFSFALQGFKFIFSALTLKIGRSSRIFVSYSACVNSISLSLYVQFCFCTHFSYVLCFGSGYICFYGLKFILGSYCCLQISSVLSRYCSSFMLLILIIWTSFLLMVWFYLVPFSNVDNLLIIASLYILLRHAFRTQKMRLSNE
jgi:hypothetical protein